MPAVLAQEWMQRVNAFLTAVVSIGSNQHEQTRQSTFGGLSMVNKISVSI